MFQATVLLPQISEDLTIFFFKLLLTSVENHTKADFLCASTQYCHNTSLLTADLIIKITMSTQEQEPKKFLEMLAGKRPK